MKLKKLKILPLILLLLIGAAAFAACNNSQGTRENSKYTIAAIYDGQKGQVDAQMTLDFVNNTEAELKELRFHLYPRAFRQGATVSPVHPKNAASVYPAGMSYGDMSIFKVERDGEQVNIQLGGTDEDILIVPGKIKPFGKTTVFVDFRVDLPQIKHRLGVFEGVANLGNWYPIACLYKNGEWQDSPYYSIGDPFYSEVADYDVTVTTDENLVVATSGRQTTAIVDGKKVTYSAIQNARDAALVIGEFNVASDTQNGVEVNYYYKTDSDPAATVQTSFDALNTFGELFGDYAYETLSVVKNPFCFGGMEYPALIYISDAAGAQHTEIVVHEIAHQWWYAAVGNDQVNEPWLDEAMAEYSTTLFYENNPSYGVTREKRIADVMTGYLLFCEFEKDNGRGDTSMNRRVCCYSHSTEYSMMVYAKGAIMLDTLRDAIGEKAFLGGIRAYYKDKLFGFITTDEFIGYMEAASKTELGGFFESWLTGKVKLSQ